MTSDALAILDCIFGTVWRIFTSWNIPGTNVTPGMFLIFLVVAGVGLRLLSSFFPEFGPARDTVQKQARDTARSYLNARDRAPAPSNALPPHRP